MRILGQITRMLLVAERASVAKVAGPAENGRRPPRWRTVFSPRLGSAIVPISPPTIIPEFV